MKSDSSLPGETAPANTAAAKNTFFKLTPEVSERLIRCDLSKNDMKLWLYLVAIAPFGDRPYSYSASEAMLACGIKKTGYFASKAKLQKLGLIDFRDGETKFVNKLALADTSSEVIFFSGKVVRKNELLVRKNELDSGKTNSTPEKRTRLRKNELPEAGTRSGSEAVASSDSSDYSEFKKTLSDCQRENFFDFGRKKASQLPKPPELPDKWIATNWEELRSQWERTKEGSAAVTNLTDWTQHPDWATWLEEMRRGVPRFVALGTCFDNKTRRAIADWADERGLIWGEES